MMSLTFSLFTQVSGSGPLGPLVSSYESNFVDMFPDLKGNKTKSAFRGNNLGIFILVSLLNWGQLLKERSCPRGANSFL